MPIIIMDLAFSGYPFRMWLAPFREKLLATLPPSGRTSHLMAANNAICRSTHTS